MAAGPSIGERLGKYLIEAELGRGGMGVVYRARHVSLDRVVAIKLVSAELSAEAEGLKRFRLEAQAIARLNHPNIVQVFDIEESDALTYLVMEYVAGQSLDAILERSSLSIRRIARVAADIAGALHFAHGKGVLHRDIKPANVLLTEDRQVKVADFGLAYLLDTDKGYTKTGILVGSPHYMSPEQCQGLKLDGRTDMYSLGVVLFRMLTGRLPFPSESGFGVLVRKVKDAAPDPKTLVPDLPAELVSVVRRALEMNPTDRFADLREMQSELLSFLGEKPVEAIAAEDTDVTLIDARGPSPGGSATELVTPPTEFVREPGLPTAATTSPGPSGPVTASRVTGGGATAATTASGRASAETRRGDSGGTPRPPSPRRPIPAAPPARRSSALPWLLTVLVAAAAGGIGTRFLPPIGGSPASGPAPGPEAVAGAIPAPAPTSSPLAETLASPPVEPTAAPLETGPDPTAVAAPAATALPLPEPTATAVATVPPPSPTRETIQIAEAVPAVISVATRVAVAPAKEPSPVPPPPTPTHAPPAGREESIRIRVGGKAAFARGFFCLTEGEQAYRFPKGGGRSDGREVQIRFDVTPGEPRVGESAVVRAHVTNGSAADLFVERLEESDPTGASPPSTLALVKTVPPGQKLELRTFTVQLESSSRIRRAIQIVDGPQSWTRSFELAPCD